MDGSAPSFSDKPLAGKSGSGTVPPMRRTLISLTLALFVWNTGAAERIVDLSNQAVGREPANFRAITGGTGKPGVWRIAADKVPPLIPAFTPGAAADTTQNVIAQSATDEVANRTPMLLFDEEDFADFTCKLRFKIVEGALRQQAGIAFRVQDEKNYYVIRANAASKSFTYSKVYDGNPIGSPISVPAPVEKGKWHTIAVQCNATSINVFFDGQQLIPTMTDITFKSGAVGLWTLGDTIAYFTDIKLDFKHRVVIAQQLVNDTMKKYSRLRGMQIYTLLSNKPGVHLVASNDPTEVGQVGGKTEEQIIQEGVTAYGSESRRKVSVVVPLRDRNGDPVAAVRFKMNRFPGETRDTSVAKTQPMIRDMQRRIQSINDLVD